MQLTKDQRKYEKCNTERFFLSDASRKDIYELEDMLFAAFRKWLDRDKRYSTYFTEITNIRKYKILNKNEVEECR